MMKVKHLSVDSFRGIEKLTLEFEPTEPTVLIGANGVGKSSILDCLAILLSWFTARLQNPQSSGRLFREEDIKTGSKETHNEITVMIDSHPVKWSRTKARSGCRKDTSSNLAELRKVVSDIHERLDENPETALPILAYYPTNRAVLDIPLRIRKKHFFENPIAGYEEGLTGGAIAFRRFFEWFREREDLENERRLMESIHYRDRQLEAVRQAISRLLDGIENIRIQRSPLRMTISKQGEQLSVSQLSDGEKCLLALVGDLARRLAIANPDPDTNPLNGSGVVFIDEIELHLYPKWQRGIIPALTHTFPNCQFTVTTHSPQVISDVEWVQLLTMTSEGIVAEKLRSFGKDSNRILETLMDTRERPPEIEEKFLELFRLIDRGELDKARQLRQQLAEKLGSDDPKFVRADGLIRRKEILNR
ncbi:AAA family ATPase [Phormidium sp. CCY1219]|uniref:AAA family ATPase n=1 Tax=Phormidium sp. CCY1219 TaxID=2886104 RepID=UPI002D1F2BF4|nr:AAA family ATPase [Phormidium sp. CCY1219]MEB3826284.1 AAA family ATPase [Phormidium sp. CCY1219]